MSDSAGQFAQATTGGGGEFLAAIFDGAPGVVAQPERARLAPKPL